jgi:hypothetical protein
MQVPDPIHVVVLKMLTLTPAVLLSPVTYTLSKREITMIGTTTKARTFLLTWNK